MEGCCSFKALVGGICGYDARDRKRDTEIVPLLSCGKDISSHKSLYKFTGPEDEVELILCRAAKFTKSKSLSSMTICPNHRTKLGIGWSRGSSTRCRVPEEISNHGKGKGVWPKGERGLGKRSLRLSYTRLVRSYKLGQVSFIFLLCRLSWVINAMVFLCHSGVCRKCRERLKDMTDIEGHDPSDPISQMRIDSNINDQMARMTLVSIQQFTLIHVTSSLRAGGIRRIDQVSLPMCKK